MIDRPIRRWVLFAAVAIAAIGVTVALLPPYPLLVWVFLAGVAATVVAVAMGIWSAFRDQT